MGVSMKHYSAQYRDAGRWVRFTVLTAPDAYKAFDIAREIVGPRIGLAVFGEEIDGGRLRGGRC